MFAIPTLKAFADAVAGTNSEQELVSTALRCAHKVIKDNFDDPQEDIERLYISYISILHVYNDPT